MLATCQFFFIIYLLFTITWNDDQTTHLVNDTKKGGSGQHQGRDNESNERELLRKDHKYNRKVNERTQTFSSDVFCTGRAKRERECRFHNLCYNTSAQTYFMVHNSSGSRVFGVPTEQGPLLDLSSVDDHSAKYFSYDNITASEFSNEVDDVEYVEGSSVLFHRFNPDNIMHVFHDDLIPLFHTLRRHFPRHTTVSGRGREHCVNGRTRRGRVLSLVQDVFLTLIQSRELHKQ